jgi:hypothetical protein
MARQFGFCHHALVYGMESRKKQTSYLRSPAMFLRHLSTLKSRMRLGMLRQEVVFRLGLSFLKPYPWMTFGAGHTYGQAEYSVPSRIGAV